jgi:acetylornithine/succinyldiaminopimelate/putrescine aminotransferase
VLDQLERYWHTMVYGEHVQHPQVRLATLLHQYLGPSFEQVYLANSGAEAIEGAMKLVKKASGRTRLVSFRNAYHGGTQGALSLLGSESYRSPFRPLLPETYLLDYNDVAGLDFLDERVAGVFVEAVQAEAGAVPAQPGWLKALEARCRMYGIALVLDEIQTGLGRCGTWFGFQHDGIVPDVVVLAKGLGGGLPIGAFAASSSMMKHLAERPPLGHLTTFGGNPVCSAAAVAVIEVIRDQDLAARAVQSYSILAERVSSWSVESGMPVRLCGRGLLLGLELEQDAERAREWIARCWQAGLLVDWFLFNERRLRLAPPLNISEGELHDAMDILRKAWG